jgi:Glycosyl transferase family 2
VLDCNSTDATSAPANSVRPDNAVEGPRISVVIPSVHRETLRRAVDSALYQTYPPVEVIVVFDLEALPTGLDLPADGVRTILTGGRRGPNAARQMGADASVGDAIAFLDDDDYWFLNKLKAQASLMQQARRTGSRAVVTAGVQVVDPDGAILNVVPRRLIRDGQAITDYLFKRREVQWGEAAMGPSTLLIDKELLTAVPLDQQLRLFEDWDWLLRVGNQERVCFRTAEDVHLAYCLQPRGKSLSRSPMWASCIEWADQRRELLSPREYGDFLLGIGVARAIDAGNRTGALRIAAQSFKGGRPGPAAIVAAASLLLMPRSIPSVFLRGQASWRRALQRMHRSRE